MPAVSSLAPSVSSMSQRLAAIGGITITPIASETHPHWPAYEIADEHGEAICVAIRPDRHRPELVAAYVSAFMRDTTPPAPPSRPQLVR